MAQLTCNRSIKRACVVAKDVNYPGKALLGNQQAGYLKVVGAQVRLQRYAVGQLQRCQGFCCDNTPRRSFCNLFCMMQRALLALSVPQQFDTENTGFANWRNTLTEPKPADQV